MAASSLSLVQRRTIIVGSALLGVAGLVWMGTAWFGEAFVRAVYAGDLLPYLGRLLRIHAANNPAHQGVEFYVQLIEGTGWRLFLLSAVFFGLLVLCVRMRPSLLVDFFGEDGSPLSLAIFRIAVFGLLLYNIDVSAIVESAQKASDVRYAPLFMGWLFNHVPLAEPWVRGAARALQGACVLALVGVFTRSAAWIAGGLGVYVLGIPELLGKINHGNHMLIWFALLLGAAPSGEALSVDALMRAWTHPNDPEAGRPSSSPRYGRPLRWAWLLIGLIYFFPGFWKFMLSGMDWMFSENLKFKMYAKWHQLQYLPSMRIDQIPLVYKGLAAFTVVFELFFIVVILFRRWRPYAVLSGIGFHLGIAHFMRIVFRNLLGCYVVFVPWGKALRRTGNVLFPAPLTVRYNASDPMLKRLMNVVRVGDWLWRIRYEPVPHLEAQRGLEALRNGDNWTGGSAFGRILLRTPLLWPLAPVLVVLFIIRPRMTAPSLRSASLRSARSVVTLTGGVLFGVNVVFGLFLINSWPFSVYPTHAGISGPHITDVQMEIATPKGDTLDAKPVLGLSGSRRRGLMRQVISAPDSTTQAQALQEVARLVEGRLPDAIEAATLRVYRVKISKVPEQWSQNPVNRALLLQVPLARPSEK